MATNLLLEGDDLEALLMQAHSAGGPTARIVRADKYRHGGVWGFFARERFEVAIEIPDGRAVPPGAADEGAAFFPATADGDPAARPGTGRAKPLAGSAAAGSGAGSGTASGAGSVERLLGMADRASRAERESTAGRIAAGRAGTSGRAGTAGRAAAGTSIDLPAAEAPGPDDWGQLVGAGAPARSSRLSAYGTAGSSRRPAGPSATAGPGAVPGSAAAGGLSLEEPAPVEPRPSPVRPSVSRPEFTALLDTLRDGGDGRDPGAGPRPGDPRPVDDDPSDHVSPDDYVRVGADRDALRALGVPEEWVDDLRAGDRFTRVLEMLRHLPEPDVDPDARVVAVVGPAGSVLLEAHRTALDLATDAGPRPVVVVPATPGVRRAAAIDRALRSGPIVLAVETPGDGTDRDEAALVVDALATVRVGAVIAVVDALTPAAVTRRRLNVLGRVDALVLDHAADAPDPASALQHGLPVVRLDGIPVDRVTWTALLCAQLLAAERAGRGLR